MAKFADYAQKQDELAQEIEQAQQDHQERVENPDNAIPERFRNKTAAEIAASYVELERKFSQQGNDLGQLRSTVDTWMKLQSERTDETTASKANPLSTDDLYDNPDEAVRRVVREETGTKIAELEAQLEAERWNAKLKELDGQYPGWRDVANTQEFVDWVAGSQYRLRLVQAADQQKDLAAASDLLEMYYDVKKQKAPSDNFERNRDLRNASLESGGASQPEMVETFSRADLMSARIAAKHGDQKAIAWLNKNREAIAIAYEEGHITD